MEDLPYKIGYIIIGGVLSILFIGLAGTIVRIFGRKPRLYAKRKTDNQECSANELPYISPLDIDRAVKDENQARKVLETSAAKIAAENKRRKGISEKKRRGSNDKGFRNRS
jgi:hypothetical protein